MGGATPVICQCYLHYLRHEGCSSACLMGVVWLRGANIGEDLAGFYLHKITEPVRLEKTSEIIESNLLLCCSDLPEYCDRENMKIIIASTESDGQDINSSPFPCFPLDHNLQGLSASPVGMQVPQAHSSLPGLQRVCGSSDIQCLHLGFSFCSCLSPTNCWPLR